MINKSYAHAVSETITTQGGETVTQVTPEAFHAMAINFAIERDTPTFEDEDFTLTPVDESEFTLGDEYGAYLDELEARDRAMLDMENGIIG